MSRPSAAAAAVTIRPASCLLVALVGAAAFAATPRADAGELYLLAGVPGVGLGFAQPLGPRLGLRLDYVGLGSRSERRTEEGIEYDARLKAGRGGVFADWFPLAGGFRVSLGLTSNQYRLDLDASGAGRTINVGGTNYTLGAADGFTAQVKLPSTTPYVGIGWGHHAASGLRLGVDLGASVGRARLGVSGRGQFAQPAAQADLERELAELREGVGRVRLLPHLTLNLGWSF
jgi:hypothetical protein